MKNFKLMFKILLFVALAGCQPTDSTKHPNRAKQEGGVVQNFGMIMGTAKDMNGQFLADVKIKTQGLTTQTNAQGYFALSNLPETDRLIVEFEKQGYVTTTDIVRIRIGESSYLEPVLKAEEYHQTFTANTGALVTSTANSASVKIPTNALVDSTGHVYQGNVDVALTPFDPTTPAGQAAFPGEFVGVNRNGEKVPIESYGFMDITPRTPDGKPLQLAQGQFAEIAIPIAASLVNQAPATMPLWYFNRTDGQWHEEGSLTRDGNLYRGKVGHFSIWNCDVAYDRSYVIGHVVDCANLGLPVKGARVTIKGQRGWTSGESSTPEDGSFRIPVDSNHNCEIWASKNGVESDHKNFMSAGSNGVVDVGNICIGTPKIKIALSWGSEPRDLDAHLTYSIGNSRAHVYYGNKRTNEALLDTDDTSSFGPEIISVFKLVDGIYRYSVHHFNGNGTMSNSNAIVSMMIDGVGIYQLTAPAGAQAIGDLWILWDIKVENGKVIDVNPVHQLKLQSAGRTEKDYSPLW